MLSYAVTHKVSWRLYWTCSNGLFLACFSEGHALLHGLVTFLLTNEKVYWRKDLFWFTVQGYTPSQQGSHGGNSQHNSKRVSIKTDQKVGLTGTGYNLWPAFLHPGPNPKFSQPLKQHHQRLGEHAIQTTTSPLGPGHHAISLLLWSLLCFWEYTSCCPHGVLQPKLDEKHICPGLLSPSF